MRPTARVVLSFFTNHPNGPFVDWLTAIGLDERPTRERLGIVASNPDEAIAVGYEALPTPDSFDLADLPETGGRILKAARVLFDRKRSLWGPWDRAEVLSSRGPEAMADLRLLWNGLDLNPDDARTIGRRIADQAAEVVERGDCEVRDALLAVFADGLATGVIHERDNAT